MNDAWNSQPLPASPMTRAKAAAQETAFDREFKAMAREIKSMGVEAYVDSCRFDSPGKPD
jgi:hypothetical protein